jgi:phospholipid/cholesterol/gamma-HCH transport system permease protein
VQGLALGNGGARARAQIESLKAALVETAAAPGVSWDLTGAEALDHVGALLMWRAWGGRAPERLHIDAQHQPLFDTLARMPALPPEQRRVDPLGVFVAIGRGMFRFGEHLSGFVRLLGQITLDVARFGARPHLGPWREISANLYRSGAQALGITALVGFLIGIVLSYLSAKQLKQFGADVFIVDLLGVAIIRELGPVLAAILVAGRSGSAMTASLGVMRVTEELDALTVMGIPHGFRLIMPKVVALAIALPLLTLWTDAISLLGGMVAAKIQLDLSIAYFFNALPNAVKIANLWIGLGKGIVFGALIALVSCHFGLRIEPNTESLGRGTTSAVVTSITVVILVDAIFAIAFSNVGI